MLNGNLLDRNLSEATQTEYSMHKEEGRRRILLQKTLTGNFSKDFRY